MTQKLKGSSMCFVHLIVIAMFHANVVSFSTSPLTILISSSLPSICSSYCLSPSSSLMLWITTIRTAAEEIGLHGQEQLLHTLEDEVNHDGTGKPVVCPQEGATQTRLSRDSTNFNVEDETNHDRTETRCLP